MNKKNKWLVIGGVIALVIILIAAALIGRLGPASDPHAGHNHDTQQTTPTGTGTAHGHTHDQNAGKLTYNPVENKDGTYSFTIEDKDGKVLFRKDGLDRYPMVEAVNEDMYSVGWPTGTGPNDFQQIYCHREKGLVSPAFDGPIGSDGVRVALPHKDGVLVRDIFDEKAYSKVHALKGAYTKGDYVVVGGKLIEGQKAVRVTYITDEKGTYATTVIELYAK